MGIRKKDKQRLFKLYSSIKSNTVNQKGIGLGLVISKLIVEKFNGMIDFISKWKKGTTFFFTFEIENYHAIEVKNFLTSSPHTIKKSCTRNAIAKSEARVLVADDDEFCL